MPKIDMKHPYAKRIVVFDEKGEQVRACLSVDTDAGVADCFEVNEMRHADVIDSETKEVKVKGEPYYMIKKDEKGEKIRKKLLGKFTLKWRNDDGEITDVPSHIKL